MEGRHDKLQLAISRTRSPRKASKVIKRSHGSKAQILCRPSSFEVQYMMCLQPRLARSEFLWLRLQWHLASFAFAHNDSAARRWFLVGVDRLVDCSNIEQLPANDLSSCELRIKLHGFSPLGPSGPTSSRSHAEAFLAAKEDVRKPYVQEDLCMV
jgi:hypothetical protein